MEKQENIKIEIIGECNKQGKNYILSKTGENEVLIYTCDDGNYKNIIIDSDGDIEFMYISDDRSKSYNEYIKDINIEELVNRL